MLLIQHASYISSSTLSTNITCSTRHYHTTTHCKALQHKWARWRWARTLPATYCITTLQYTAVYCNALQHIAAQCNTDELVEDERTFFPKTALPHCSTTLHYSVLSTLQYTTIYCIMLQRTATRMSLSTLSTDITCNKRQYTATHYAAVHCNTQQCISTQKAPPRWARKLPPTHCVAPQHTTLQYTVTQCNALHHRWTRRVEHEYYPQQSALHNNMLQGGKNA